MPKDREVFLHYINGVDVANLALTDDEIINAVEAGLMAQARGETVLEPRVFLSPNDELFNGHLNILRGYVGPLNVAGVKIVSDYVDNYQHDLPSEMAILNLFDPSTGKPVAIINATWITDARTGALTTLGAKHLARKGSRVLGHIGARGTAYWNVRLLDRVFDFDEIRVHSRRPESRNAFGERLSRELGKKITVTDDWESCVRGADIVVEASRLGKPEPLLKTEWIKRGALVMPYGADCALELSLTDIMDKMVVDDWRQSLVGPYGALTPHVRAGRLSKETLYAELHEIAAGKKPGRESDDETILFWHRGLSLSDISLGHALLEKAKRLGIGQQLRYA